SESKRDRPLYTSGRPDRARRRTSVGRDRNRSRRQKPANASSLIASADKTPRKMFDPRRFARGIHDFRIGPFFIYYQFPLPNSIFLGLKSVRIPEKEQEVCNHRQARRRDADKEHGGSQPRVACEKRQKQRKRGNQAHQPQRRVHGGANYAHRFYASRRRLDEIVEPQLPAPLFFS